MKQPLYDEIAQAVPSVEFHEGYPADLEFDGRPTLLVLEDMMINLSSGDTRLVTLFTRMRHQLVSNIFVTQNLFFQSKYATTVARNAQYLCIFPNVRDSSMLLTLNKQIFPLHKSFLPAAFADATKMPYSYLWLDLKSDTDHKLRVLSDIFNPSGPIVYRPRF